jgi:hypothetical protein
MKLKIFSLILIATIGIAWFAFKSPYEETWPAKCLGPIITYKITDTIQLLERSCSQASYRPTHAYMWAEENQSRLMKFPDQDTYEIWGWPRFNPDTQRLTVQQKESSADPCMDQITYEFQDGVPEVFERGLICSE